MASKDKSTDEATEKVDLSPPSAESISGWSLTEQEILQQYEEDRRRNLEAWERRREAWERRRDGATEKVDLSRLSAIPRIAFLTKDDATKKVDLSRLSVSHPSAVSTSGFLTEEEMLRFIVISEKRQRWQEEWRPQEELWRREEQHHREAKTKKKKTLWERFSELFRKAEATAGDDSTETMPRPSSVTGSEVHIQGGSVKINPANTETLNYIVEGNEEVRVPSAESDSSVTRRLKSQPISQKDWFSILDEQNRRLYGKKDSALHAVKGKNIKEKNPWVQEVSDLYKGELLEKKTQLKKEDSLIPDGDDDEDFNYIESETKNEIKQEFDVEETGCEVPMHDISDDEDDQASASEKLNYEALLEYISDNDMKHVAIIGEAGAGKSILLKRLVRDITKRRPKSHPVVFRLFSGFANVTKTSLCKMLFEGSHKDSSVYENCYQWMLDNDENLVFFFDGLDQAPWPIGGTEEIFPHAESTPQAIMSNIFRRSLFPNAKVVYASRESSVAALDEDHRPDTVFALAGFSMADAKYLFAAMVGEKGKEAWKKLVTQSNPIVSLLTTPALLSFAAAVYKDKPYNPPSNTTGLMKSLLQLFIRSRHVRRFDAGNILPQLRAVSYDGIKKGKVLFMIDDFKVYELSENDILSLVSKIPGSGLDCFEIMEGDSMYYFSHQYVQEFLGAEHTIVQNVKDFTTITEEELPAHHWSIVTKFVSGILKGKDIIGAPIEDLQEKREIFREMITRQYNDGVNQLEMLTTLAESDDATLIRSLVHEISLRYLPISSARMHAISLVMLQCNALKELSFKGCSIAPSTTRILLNSIKTSRVQISRLDISRNANTEAKGFRDMMMFAAHCNVKDLNATFCELKDDHFSSLVDMPAIQKLKLKRLDLSGNYMSETSFKVIGSIIDDNSELHLVQCNITNPELEELHEALGTKRISYLDISSNAISVEGCATIGKIAKQSGIDKLVMRDCSFTDVSLEALLSAANGSKMTSFDVAWNEIGIKGSAVVGKIAKQLYISTIVLNNCKLSEAALAAFLSEAGESKISCLDISWNEIGVESAKTVAKIMNVCSVHEVAMRRCYLSNDSLDAFLANFKRKKISHLDISGNEINDEECEIVGKITKEFSLEELIMRHCGLTEESLDPFLYRAKRSELTLLNVIGNDLPQLAADRIKRRISVKEIKLDWTESCFTGPASKTSRSSRTQEVTITPRSPRGGYSASISSSEAGAELPRAPIREEIRAADPVQHVNVHRSTRRFYDAHLRSPDVYLMYLNRMKGKVLIINNEFLGQENRRDGSLVDVENLENLWNQLGFQVAIKRNLRGGDMRRSCREFALDSVNINVLVLIIMSHGGKREGEEVICGEDNQKVSTERIISYFTSENAPHLQGIPKVLMFQACRGEDFDVIVEEFPTGANIRPRRYPERSDMLIVYPSQAGYASFRNRDTGSWLMNAVTTVFMRDAKDTHVLDMLTKVNRAISLKEYDGYVQMSNQVNYLTKNLFLFPGWPN